MPGNVSSIVHEQANRIASDSGPALSTGIVVGILVSLWSAMSGVKAIIDALNVIYDQQEGRSSAVKASCQSGSTRHIAPAA